MIAKCRFAVLAGALLALAGCGGGGSNGLGILDSTGGGVSINGFSLTVPPGAVTTSMGLSVAAATSYPPSTQILPGTTYTVTPSGTNLSVPGTVIVNYGNSILPAGVVESQLQLFTVTNGVLTPVAGSTVNTGSKTVTGSVSQLGTYGIFWPSPFTGSYSGSYTGTTKGTFSFSVLSSGVATFNLVDSVNGSLTGSATLASNGSFTTTTNGNQNYVLTGNFTLGTPSTGSGTWTSFAGTQNSGSGTWKCP